MSPCDNPRSARYDLMTSPMLTLGFSLGMGSFPLTGEYLTSNSQTSANVIFEKCSWQEHIPSAGKAKRRLIRLGSLRHAAAFNAPLGAPSPLRVSPFRKPVLRRACLRTKLHRRVSGIPAWYRSA